LSFINKAKYTVKGLKEKPIYLYSEHQQYEFEKYVSENFGEFTKVYHELYSPDIHLDILIVPPSKEKNYYTLITRGIGAYKMNVPPILKDLELERMELVIKLPPDWNFDLKKEENLWAIKQLKVLGRLPLYDNCWLGYGHTFSHSESYDIPFAPNTKLSASVLINPYELSKSSFYINETEKINFYQILPLYKEEIELYNKTHDLDNLLELFSWKDLREYIDLNRKNYCENLEKNLENNEVELELE